MKLRELVRDVPLCRPAEEGLLEREISFVTCDSRQAGPGCLFVCIQGERFDGHDHAAQALESGAAAILCQRDTGNESQLLTEDSRYAYALACKHYYGDACDRLKLIGVTGTNGKTTCTCIIQHILEAAGKQAGLSGTIHTRFGGIVLPASHTTPDPLQLHSIFQRMERAGCEYVVMEVSSHGLHQKRLAGCHFCCGVFTNLTQDHLDYHGDMEHYYQAKKLLFSQCERAVLNADDAYGRRLAKELEGKLPLWTFSASSDDADFTAKQVQGQAGGVRFTFVGKGMIGRVRFAMPGEYSVSNAMAAGTAMAALGFPVQEICSGLSGCPGVTGRMEVIPTGRDFTVIRDYAHTPDGLEKAIGALRPYVKGRLIVLFGCPGRRDRAKRPLMAETVSRLADFVFFAPDNPREEPQEQIVGDARPGLEAHETPFLIISDRYEAIRQALAMCRAGDVLLLAGKGHEYYQVLEEGTIWFDEREIVTRLLAQEGEREGA